MRARYALSFGRGAHRHQLLQRCQEGALLAAAESAEILLVVEPGTPVLTAERTIVIGTLWSDCEMLQSIEPDIEALAWSCDPGALPRALWGKFVLFAIDGAGNARAYRDPSGAVGAFHFCQNGEDFLVSDAAFARKLGLLADPQIDVGFTTHWLQFPYLKTARTGVTNTCEILPGTWRCHTKAAWISRPGWNPWNYVRPSAPDAHPRSAAYRLRQTALEIVPKQIGAEPSLLQLSGGLDSSIIAACLHHSGADVEAVHFATSSADGDEQRFANEVANVCNIRLTTINETELTQGLNREVGVAFSPPSNPILAPIEEAVVACAHEQGRVLLVDGGGGDNLFCYLTTAAPVLDALSRGRRGDAIQTTLAVAEMANASWWDVVRATVCLQLQSVRRRPWKEDRSFLNRAALLGRADRHPWLFAPTRSLEGTREHVETLVEIQHFLDRRKHWCLPVVHPLMAQPLLELCLGIPSWMWVEQGRDRAVARRAFEGLIPDAVLARRLKGSLQGFVQRSFRRLRSDLRDLILDGELRRLDLLDLAALEAVFGEGWKDDEVQLRLSEIAALELWLRSWRC